MSRVYASFWTLAMIPSRHWTFTPYIKLVSGLFILECPHFSGPVICGNSRYETLICRKPGRFGPLKSWSRVSLEAIFPVLWAFSEVCCLPSHYPCSLASSYSGIRTSLMQITSKTFYSGQRGIRMRSSHSVWFFVRGFGTVIRRKLQEC